MKLCIDIGGMSSKIAVFKNEKIIYRKNYEYGKVINNVELIKILNNSIKETVEVFSEIECIGISSPGLINTETTQVSGITAIENMKEINFRRDLETRLPVFAENDAYAAAISQSVFNKKIKNKNTLVFIVGTGLGGALISKNKLVKGPNEQAGNFGFMLQDFDFSNLKIGHTISSTGGLIKLYYEKTGIQLSGKEIIEGYHVDIEKKEVTDIFIENLSKMIINANFVIDSDFVLIGGGISQSNLIIDLITKKVDSYLNLIGEPYKRKFKIETCMFGQDANLYGALALRCRNKSWGKV